MCRPVPDPTAPNQSHRSKLFPWPISHRITVTFRSAGKKKRNWSLHFPLEHGRLGDRFLCVCVCALYKDGLIPQPAAPVQPRSPFCVGVSFLLLLLLLLLLFAVSSIYYFHCQTMKLSTVALPLCLVTGWCFFFVCYCCFAPFVLVRRLFFHHSSSIFISHFLAQLLALFCVTFFLLYTATISPMNDEWPWFVAVRVAEAWSLLWVLLLLCAAPPSCIEDWLAGLGRKKRPLLRKRIVIRRNRWAHPVCKVLQRAC